MAVIVAILGFMMDPGNWNTNKSLISGFTNPIYLPQLLFRTPTAMLVGGLFGMLLTTIFAKKGTEVRTQALKYAAKWILCWAPISLLAAINYYRVMPAAMKDNMSTAVGTMEFAQYYDVLKYIIAAAILLVIVIGAFASFKPKKVRFAMVIIPCFMAFGFLGIFERVREFIRKPYVIGGYMYSNLLREEDYPLYKKDGVLAHAVYNSTPEITNENKIEAGKNVFVLTCSRCHTTEGINSITYVFERMYGFGKPLREEDMIAYIPNMHNGRTYMPPFPGNKKELQALAAFIKHVQQTGESLDGAQTEGVVVNPKQNMQAAKDVLQWLEKQKVDSLNKNATVLEK